MGRSRAASHAVADDPGQSRSKRKRTTQNADNTESATPEVPETTDGNKAFHCNYCNKDISGKIRIKCVICSDFDLCVECFSVGAEVHPHKSNHPYRVMDNLAFPLICPDWNADEEMLLLEGLEMYGLGNWNEVAEHVGTKSKSQCIEHYEKIFMNSPCFPLPDMSHVMGKGREELLAMAKEHGETKKGAIASGEVDGKEGSPFSPRIKMEDHGKECQAGRPSSGISSEVDAIGGSSSGKMSTGASKRMTSDVPGNDGLNTIKVEEFHPDRSIGEKKPRTSGDEGISMKELSGYNSKRQEFEIEYDNDAEQLLADMEFKETDTDAERELKLRVLRIYLKRLDERKRRKDFILERNLLYPDPFEKDLTFEEKELCHRYRVFMRFHSKEEHNELLRSVVEEQRILKRIQNLQEARAAGCRTSAEAERYIEQNMKKELEENACRMKEAGSSGKYLQRMNHQKEEQDTSSPRIGNKSPSVLDPGPTNSSSNTRGLTGSDLSDNWDVTGFLGADILSEAEKQLCGEIRILPTHYLNMLQTMSMGILSGNLTNKSDAYGLFNVDPGKVDKVYDMLIRKGIAQT